MLCFDNSQQIDRKITLICAFGVVEILESLMSSGSLHQNRHRRVIYDLLIDLIFKI